MCIYIYIYIHLNNNNNNNKYSFEKMDARFKESIRKA